MDIATLASRRALTAASLTGEHLLYRVQLPAPRSTSVVIGPVIMSPAGIMAYRFDLRSQPVGYFAFENLTAVYETLARRDARSIALATVKARDLLTVRFRSGGLHIADLRPHTTDWPVLQSNRYSSTQALAADLQTNRYDGVLYSSAQHFAVDCLALFGAANAALTRVSSDALFDPATTRLHGTVVAAEHGSELPII